MFNSLLLYSKAVPNLSPVQYKFVLLANKANINNFDMLHMSFMYSINSTGPSTEPCGTSQVTVTKSQSALFIHLY